MKPSARFIKFPGSDQGRFIVLPQTAGDTQLTSDEMLLMALDAELDRLSAEVAQLKLKERVLMDMHMVLGVEWGDDPYAAIARLSKDAQRLRDLLTKIDDNWPLHGASHELRKEINVALADRKEGKDGTDDGHS